MVQISPGRNPESAALSFKPQCRDLPFRGEQSRLEVRFPRISAGPTRIEVLAPACSSTVTWPRDAADAAGPGDQLQLHQQIDARAVPLSPVPIPFFIHAIDDLYPGDTAAPHAHVAAIGPGWSGIALATHGGVSILDRDGSIGSSLLARDGLASALVQSIEGDDSRLWIGTSRGPCEALRDTREVSCWDDAALRGDVRQIVQDPAPGGSCAWVLMREGGILHRVWDDGKALHHARLAGAWNQGIEAMRWLPSGDGWELWVTNGSLVTLLRRGPTNAAGCAAATLEPVRSLTLPGADPALPARADAGSVLARDPWSPDGRWLWLARGSSLYRLDRAAADPGQGEVEPLAAPLPGLINALEATSDGLWIGTEAGLYRLDRNADLSRATPLEVPLAATGLGPEARPRVRALYRSTAGAPRLWVGLEQGLLACDEATRACTTLPTRPPGFEGTRLTAAFKGSGRRFWIGDRQGGVHVLYQPRGTNRPVLRTCEQSTAGGDYRRAVTVLREQAGALWIGHERGLRRMALEPRTGSDTGETGALCPVSAGGVEIRFDMGGYPTQLERRVQALAADNLGRLWIGTTDGLYLSQDGATAQRRVHGETLLPIQTLLIDARDRLWLATPRGLACYAGSEYDVACPELPAGVLPSALAGAAVTHLFQGSSGPIYAGTAKGELFALEGGSRLAAHPLPPPVPGSMPPIRGLSEDRAGNLWVLMGTGEDGTEQAWSLTSSRVWVGPYTPDHGLISSGGMLARDWREALWLGSSLTWVTPLRECSPEQVARSVQIQLLAFGLFMLGWLWIVNRFSLELFGGAGRTARITMPRTVPLLIFVVAEGARWASGPDGALQPLSSSMSPYYEAGVTLAVLAMLRTGLLATTRPPVRWLILGVALFSFLGWAFAGRGVLPPLGIPTLDCLSELPSHGRQRLFLELAGLAVLITPMLLSLWKRENPGELDAGPETPVTLPPVTIPPVTIPPVTIPPATRQGEPDSPVEPTPGAIEPPSPLEPATPGTTEPPSPQETTPTEPPATPPARDLLFISYARGDKRWLQRLQTHLKPRVRSGRIAVWDDTRLKPGSKRRDELKEALARARVAVLLISPDYLASDYLQEYELRRLLEVAEEGGLVIAWAAVRASAWEQTPLARYKALNDPSRPLNTLHHARLDQEMEEICRQLQALFEEQEETGKGSREEEER